MKTEEKPELNETELEDFAQRDKALELLKRIVLNKNEADRIKAIGEAHTMLTKQGGVFEIVETEEIIRDLKG